MSVQDISNNMMSVVQLGMSEEAKAVYALSGLTIAGAATGYAMHKQVVKPAQLALTNCIESQRGRWNTCEVKVCDFLVGRQTKATEVVPCNTKGLIHVTLQGVDEVVTRIKGESYKSYANKFQKIEMDDKAKSFIKKLFGETKVVKKVEENFSKIENKLACITSYGYKQVAFCALTPVAQLGMDYFVQEFESHEDGDQGLFAKLESSLRQGAEVKLKQEVADQLEKYIDLRAALAGHATICTLRIALVNGLVLHFGNHQMFRGGACLVELLSADSVSEGVSRLLSFGVREITHSSVLSMTAYIGGRAGFLTGELLIRAYQNQLMLAQDKGEASNWNAYLLNICDFLVGKQEKATKLVSCTAKGLGNLTLQGVSEAADRIQKETYETHAAKFQKKGIDEKTTTLMEKLVGENTVLKKVGENITVVENEVACRTAHVYKQAAAYVIAPLAQAAIDLSDEKEVERDGSLSSMLVEGAQVKLKQEVADWVEKYIDTGATWAGHTTARTLKVALVDALILQLGDHKAVKRGASIAEVLSAESIPDGVSRFISMRVREMTQSSTLSSAVYVGGRIGFLTGELLIRAYQNRVMNGGGGMEKIVGEVFESLGSEEGAHFENIEPLFGFEDMDSCGIEGFLD